MPAVDDDPLDEQPKDGLLGVEVGVQKLGFEGLDELLGPERPASRYFGLHVLGVELGQVQLCGEAFLLDGLDPRSKGLQGEGPDLERFGEAVGLPGQFLDAGFGFADAVIGLRRRGGGQFHPGGELTSQGVGVEQEIAHRSPDRVIHAGHP